jgi:hypothetical protein
MSRPASDDDPARLPSLFQIAEIVQHFEWTVEELKSVGLEESEFKQKLARLRLLMLSEGWVLVE